VTHKIVGLDLSSAKSCEPLVYTVHAMITRLESRNCLPLL